MNYRMLVAATALLPILVAAIAANADKPAHEKVLEYLKSTDDVIARPLTDLHPIRTAFNAEAPIPPQCYTQTAGRFNPCYVCHQNPVQGRENKMGDGGLQLAYAFSDVGMTNHWSNLFEERSELVAEISDEEILAWIDEDNYSELPARLKSAGFEGWIPDLKNLQMGAGAFDEQGFARDGSQWVAFNYKPLPSTFWPTNGSTDDVMIRLAAPFRTNAAGEYVKDIYLANLSLVEANIKGLNQISTPPLDENKIGNDLDGDGQLGIIERISVTDAYVGAAAAAFKESWLYPKGTEFLHTVRYVGLSEDGQVVPSTRMKEVRYMRKWQDYGKVVYSRQYQLENFEKELAHLPQYQYLGDYGLDNKFGWAIQGFIEGHDGRLRTLTYEENLFCMGCHTSVGATTDKTFGFPRKIDGAAGWGYIDLVGMPDAPNMGEEQGEIMTYFERVGGGGEFRSNAEMFERWFTEDGVVDKKKVAAAPDVYTLITPSPSRALELNKAYKAIVSEQDYIYGRDATITPPKNVHDFIDNETAPTLPANLFFNWDIRLDWQAAYEAVGGMQVDEPDTTVSARPSTIGASVGRSVPEE